MPNSPDSISSDSQLTAFGDTLIGEQGRRFRVEEDLLDSIHLLPKREGVTLRFVDYDGTLFDENRRNDVDHRLDDPKLKGDAGVEFIVSEYDEILDVETGRIQKSRNIAYETFSSLLDPANHLYKNIDQFYDPSSPYDFILTAGDPAFQVKKVKKSGFGKKAKAIYVTSGALKIRAMLEKVVELGYIPGNIEFYDDRIDHREFDGGAEFLSKALRGSRVIFYSTKEKNTYIADSSEPKYSGKGVKIIVAQTSENVGNIMK